MRNNEKLGLIIIIIGAILLLLYKGFNIGAPEAMIGGGLFIGYGIARLQQRGK